MLKYHRRKQHKAAQLRAAAAAHRSRLVHIGAAQWLSVGLARHETKLEAATARAAERAAEGLRKAERYARHWQAVTARRRRADAEGPAAAGWGASGAEHGAGVGGGGGGFYREVWTSAPAPHRPVSPPAQTGIEAAGAEAEPWAAAGCGHHSPPHAPPPSAAGVPRLPDGAAFDTSWEAALPPPRQRAPPRPLPPWMGAAPARGYPSISAPSPEQRAAHSVVPPTPTLARVAPPAAAVPPAAPDSATAPAAVAAAAPPQLPPGAPLSPPRAAADRARGARDGAEGPSFDKEAAFSSPSSVIEAANQVAAQSVQAEVASIERQLRQYAHERAEHEESAQLHARLEAQAARLEPAQRGAVVDALSRLKVQLEESAATQRQRQVTIEKLAARIGELREHVHGQLGEA